MKICVAQTKPAKGDIESNIYNHIKLIRIAVDECADIIIFPELSLTGYEPALAKKLATSQDDYRFDVFQKISDLNKIIIGVGVPTKNDEGINISMILFHPNKYRQLYSKSCLHSDEEDFFIPGKNSIYLIGDTNIAPAICYELSVPEHAENAVKNHAKIYIASVAKTQEGVYKAARHLSDIAINYSIPVLMSNSVGYCDNFECGGKTSVWNDKGILSAQLNELNEGIIILDSKTGDVIEKMI